MWAQFGEQVPIFAPSIPKLEYSYSMYQRSFAEKRTSTLTFCVLRTIDSFGCLEKSTVNSDVNFAITNQKRLEKRLL